MSLFICPNQPSLQLRVQVTNNKFIINKPTPPPLLNRIIYEPCNYRGGQDAQIQDTSLVLWPTFIMSNTQVQSENMLYRATLPCRARALRIHSKSLQFFYTRICSLSVAVCTKHSYGKNILADVFAIFFHIYEFWLCFWNLTRNGNTQTRKRQMLPVWQQRYEQNKFGVEVDLPLC